MFLRGSLFLRRKLNSFSSEQVHLLFDIFWYFQQVHLLPNVHYYLYLQVYPERALCQPTQLWRWFCQGSVTTWQGAEKEFFSNEIPSTTTTIGLERTEPLEMFPSGQRQLMERWRRRSGEILSETSDWVLGSIIPSLSFGTTWSSSTQMPRSFTDSDLGSFIEGAFVLTR